MWGRDPAGSVSILQIFSCSPSIAHRLPFTDLDRAGARCCSEALLSANEQPYRRVLQTGRSAPQSTHRRRRRVSGRLAGVLLSAAVRCNRRESQNSVGTVIRDYLEAPTYRGAGLTSPITIFMLAFAAAGKTR